MPSKTRKKNLKKKSSPKSKMKIPILRQRYRKTPGRSSYTSKKSRTYMNKISRYRASVAKRQKERELEKIMKDLEKRLSELKKGGKRRKTRRRKKRVRTRRNVN